MDHNICSVRTIFNMCIDVFLFLQNMDQQQRDIRACLEYFGTEHQLSEDQVRIIYEDFLKDPVVGIHCKAGKGRTGLIICCYLLFTETFETVQATIDHYDETRTQNNKALTIPSQIRQVYHFKHFLEQYCSTGHTKPGQPKNYFYNALKNHQKILEELDRLDNIEDNYQDINCLNIFTMTLGPFEKMMQYCNAKDP